MLSNVSEIVTVIFLPYVRDVSEYNSEKLDSVGCPNFEFQPSLRVFIKLHPFVCIRNGIIESFRPRV